MKLRFAIFESLLALIAVPALAQEQAPSSNAGAQAAMQGSDGDIVVTALRQSSLLSKTPVAMSAVSSESLRTLGINDASSIANAVPNVAMSQNNQSFIIQIRGVSSTDTTEKGDPSAAFLLDGIYIARPQDQSGAFFDVERVEVLRGPQGTLYGRNTTAGVINVITKRPTHEFEGSFDGQFGSLGTINATGVINVPVTATLGLRAAVNYQRQDNVILPSSHSPYSLDPARDLLSGRLSFGGEVGERFNFVIRGDYARDHGSTFSTLPLSNFFPGPIVKGQDPKFVDIGSARDQRTLPFPLAYPSRRHDDLYGIMGEFTYDLGGAQLTYLGSWRQSKRDYATDLLFIIGETPARTRSILKQQSHELRLAFGTDNPLHGQVGLYYFREHGGINVFLYGPFGALFGNNVEGETIDQYSVTNSSKAAFGQLTYDVTPSLHITGGLRYTSDYKARFGVNSLVYNDGTADTPINYNIAHKKYRKLTWRAGIDYDVPNLGLLYASVSTGYKAGGFNDGCEVGTGPACAVQPGFFYFKPETLTAYEAGFKFRLSDRIRVNTSVFHYDYKDIQVTQVVSATTGVLTRNAGKAKVDGIEFEGIFTPTPRDRIDLSANYTDARYTDFIPDTTFPSTTNPLDFNGDLLDRSPKWSGIATYTHTVPLPNNSNVELMGRIRYSSYYTIQDLNNLSHFRQPAFTKSTATVTYNGENRRWYLQGYVDNIENEITLSNASSGFVSQVSIDQPRTYGIRGGLRF